MPVAFIALVVFCLWPAIASATYGDTTTYSGVLYDGDGADKMQAYFDFPEDVKINSSGEFFIADTYNNVIRKIDTSNVVSTVAGTGSYGSADGAATTAAEFALPRGVAFDGSGNLYVADTANNSIRKIITENVSCFDLGMREFLPQSLPWLSERWPPPGLPGLFSQLRMSLLARLR